MNKILLLTILFVLLCVNVFAMDFYYMGYTDTKLSDTFTLHMSVMGGSKYNIENQVKCLIPMSVDITEFSIKLDTAPGIGNDFEFTLRKNGGDETDIQCTIADNDTTCSDTGSVSYSAGDFAAIKVTPTSTPTESMARYYVKFESSANNESFLCGNSLNSNLVASRFYTFSGQDASGNATEFNEELIIPTDATISDLHVALTIGPRFSNVRYFEMRLNGSDDGSPADMECQIANFDTTCSDTTNTLDVTGGDSIAIEHTILAGGRPTASPGWWGIKVTTDNNNEFIIPNSVDDSINGIKEYGCIHGASPIYSTAEEKNTALAPSGIAITKLYYEHNNAHAPLDDHVITLRIDEGDTELECSTSTSSCNDSGNVVTESEDLLAIEYDLSADAGGALVLHSSLLGTIPSDRRIW